MHVMNPSSNLLSNNNNNNNKVYLTREQIEKLKHVLDRSIPICSSPPSSSPTLNITPRHFLRQVLWKLREYSIDIIDVRLNGGAASYVLVDDPSFIYRDIDILFLIRTPLSSEQKTDIFSSNNQSYSCDVWTLIKYIVCSCLLEHITNATSTQQQPQQYTHHYLSSVLETYAKKIIKISSEQDSWALLSLQNFSGQNLELKFVEHLKRQWQFSVDSFQINLQPLLCEKFNSHSNRNSSHLCKCPSISSITKTIRTKSLVIDAINGLTIIKKEHDDDMNIERRSSQEKTYVPMTSTSPLQFGFFTPSSSPGRSIEQDNHIECQTLATITTIATSSNTNGSIEARSRSSKSSISTFNDELISSSALQFHLSLNDDTDDGIVSDADDSATEDDDQVFRTPVDTNSAPPSPATIIAMDVSTSSSSSSSPLVIEVHSEYKDLKQALEHLHKKQIATYAPETMRGGGLLKYCDLLSQNYKVHDATDMFRLQRYMCSRFFIDYKTIPEQIHVITQYITTHFLPSSISTLSPGQFSEATVNRRNNQQISNATNKSTSEQSHIMNARLCLLFFDHLLHVIQHSTVCLTHHDKELTLLSINQLKESYHYKYEYLFEGDQHHYQRYHAYSNITHPHQHCSSSSSNSSRSSSPSSSSSNSYRYYRHHPNSHNNHRHQQAFQYRHHHGHHNHNSHQNHHHHHHHGQPRTANHNTAYHQNSRNYSNDLNTNQTTSLIYHSRRHQT